MLHTSIESISSVKKRIVSIVPSITELLFSLGKEEEVIGITKFCVHPADWLKTKTIVGGTKNLRISDIEKLQPDLIIASKEENVEEQVTLLGKSIDVFLTDVITIEDGLQLISDIAKITGSIVIADPLIEKTKREFSKLTHYVSQERLIPKIVYLIWQEPFMTVGGDTFIHNMLDSGGFENIFSSDKRYPTTTTEELAGLAPDYIFLSSEPYPFNRTHQIKIQKVLPKSKIVLVDGEMFSWYGSRMAEFPSYIMKKLTL